MNIIAEIGNSHEGSIYLAKRFIDSAIYCGADYVKFQIHIFDEESLKDAPSPSYFKDEERESYLKRTSFTIDQWNELKKYTTSQGSKFLASVFSIKSAQILKTLGEDLVKIPSGEVTNLPLLKYVNRNFNTVILSSGMSYICEIDQAVKCLSDCEIVLMQCTSEYPCPPESSGLNVLNVFKEIFGERITLGYSDHTNGNAIALGARALGATWFEKHFTLSKWMYGSDSWNAEEPTNFKNYIDELTALDRALNSVVDKDKKADSLSDMRQIFQKSIVYSRDLVAGTEIRSDDLAYKKPDRGISASHYESYIGKKLRQNVNKNDFLKEGDFKL